METLKTLREELADAAVATEQAAKDYAAAAERHDASAAECRTYAEFFRVRTEQYRDLISKLN